MTEAPDASRGAADDALAVVIDRELPHPPAKVWRALTDPRLIGEWLMRTDFEPVAGRPFSLSGDWGAVGCRVLDIDEPRRLSYSWEAFGLESVVTWTLTPAGEGTRLRMEQRGFRPEQQQFFQGAQASWPGFLDKLAGVLAAG